MTTRDYLREIDQFEAHYQYDSTYMRELLQHSPEGYVRFDNFMPLAHHREVLAVEPYWVAKLATMLVEDCGDCLQLNVRLALEEGVDPSIVRAVLDGGDTLPEQLRDIYHYVRQVAGRAETDSELEKRIQAQLDKGALLELAIAIATASVFPTIKRTLGYTRSCSLITVEVPEMSGRTG